MTNPSDPPSAPETPVQPAADPAAVAPAVPAAETPEQIAARARRRKIRRWAMAIALAILIPGNILVYRAIDESAWPPPHVIPQGGVGISDEELVRQAGENIIIRSQGAIDALPAEQQHIVVLVCVLSEHVTPKAITVLAATTPDMPIPPTLSRLVDALTAFGATQATEIIKTQVMPLAKVDGGGHQAEGAKAVDAAFFAAWQAENVTAKAASMICGNPLLCQ